MSPERRTSYSISLDRVISDAKEITIRDGHHVPSLIVEGSKKDIITPIPGWPETHSERNALLKYIGQEAVTIGKIGQLRQVFIIREELLKVGSNRHRASQGPNIKEVLSISGIQMKERKKFKKLFEILRDTNQKILGFEELLPDDAKGNKLVKIPLVEAFVDGFQMKFRTRQN